MPRIICRYDVCIFNKDLMCTAKQMEYDPDQGCLMAEDRDEFDGVLDDDEEWDEDAADEAGDRADEPEDGEDGDLFDEDDDEAEDEDDF